MSSSSGRKTLSSTEAASKPHQTPQSEASNTRACLQAASTASEKKLLHNNTTTTPSSLGFQAEAGFGGGADGGLETSKIKKVDHTELISIGQVKGQEAKRVKEEEEEEAEEEAQQVASEAAKRKEQSRQDATNNNSIHLEAAAVAVAVAVAGDQQLRDGTEALLLRACHEASSTTAPRAAACEPACEAGQEEDIAMSARRGAASPEHLSGEHHQQQQPPEHTVIELSDTSSQKSSSSGGSSRRSSSTNKSANNKAQVKVKPNCLPVKLAPAQPIKLQNASLFKNQVSESNNNNINRPVAGQEEAEEAKKKCSTSEEERIELELYKRTRRLSYFQSLLLRKWPCLALFICIMSSLIFGMLLSALTVYYMHALVSDQCHLIEAAAASGAAHSALGSGAGGLLLPAVGRPVLPHELMARPNAAEFASADAPMEPLVLASPSSSSALGSALDGAAKQVALSELEARRHHQEKPGGQDSASNPNSTQQRPGAAPAAVTFQRLPLTVVPEHYDLFIWPRFDEFNFYGSVKILLHVRDTRGQTNLTLHASDLNITSASVQEVAASSQATATTETTSRRATRATTAPLRVLKIDTESALQYVVLMLDAPLRANSSYEVSMDFAGKLNDDLAGFYKIKYERANSSEPTWIAATQFQATDARRAFPCFDEPLFKATFSIKIKHLRNMTALSNMPMVSSENSTDGLWVTDSFAKSHRMSTYLVAFAVTNFESRSEGNISVWTRPGFSHTAEYALKIAGKILRHYEKFFGIEYPLPKMDMIALPDFNAGAMENWGLITYRETAMLYDENSSSVANKQRVAVVVAHELAHQWFGNLVTPKWWDDLWLNEGFASFVEYIGVDHVEPKWRMLDQFVVEEVQNVFKVDSLSSSHQISQPVNNPDEINEIFDHISYAKGASIIRMMSNFLTDEVFRLGLQRYLRALKYNNAEQSDLWAHLTEAQRLVVAAAAAAAAANSSSDSTNSQSKTKQVEMVNVERVMNSWTLQTGYPLVTVTRQYKSPAGGQEPKLGATLEQIRYQPYKLMQQQQQQQQQFNLNTNSTINNNINNNSSLVNSTTIGEEQAAQQRWEIPITYTWKSEQNWQPQTRFWMHQNSSNPFEVARELMPLDNDEWLMVNLNQVGYYRVNYDLRNWRLLIKQLSDDHERIGTTNRAQLLDDIFELAKSSLLDYNLAMEATRYLRSEREYLPWDSVLLAFGYIDDMLQRTPIYGDWKDYISELTGPYYERYKDLEWTTTPTTSVNNKLTSGQATQATNTTSSSSVIIMDSNDVLEQYNRANAVAWACQVNGHCIQKARQVFADWRSSGRNSINPALRYTAYCTSIENGDKEDWDFLWRMYEREQNASERDRIMRALGCSKEMWILSRYLEWTFDKNRPIRRQDGAYVFRMIAKNNYGRDVAFNFMREHWNTIREFYGKTSFSLGSLIRSISISMNTQVELNQLRDFYNAIQHQVGVGKRAFQIAIEEVESNVHWRNKNYKIIEEWLQRQRSPRKAPASA